MNFQQACDDDSSIYFNFPNVVKQKQELKKQDSKKQFKKKNKISFEEIPEYRDEEPQPNPW